jgi:RimJ/RimL family protein N-acetyltransferase
MSQAFDFAPAISSLESRASELGGCEPISCRRRSSFSKGFQLLNNAQEAPLAKTTVAMKEGKPFHLRGLAEDDGDRIYDYFLRLSQKSRDFFHPYAFTREEAEAIARTPASPRRFYLCAMDPESEKIMGVVFYGIDQPTGGFPSLGIGIADDSQGKGVGRILMDSAICEAERSGREGLVLTVYKVNLRALSLYASCGFVIEGETETGEEHRMRLTFRK